jgi:hypothetical protein
MIEVRNDFQGGMNKDSSYYKLPQGSYVDALNITRDSIDYNEDKVITNIRGTRFISYSLPAGENTQIGGIGNPIRNTEISFVYNSEGYHSIVEYNLTTREAAKVLENLTDTDGEDILGFTLSGKITGVNILNRDEGDLLFFLDSLGRPTFLNIESFKNGDYTPVTRKIIDVAVNWPAVPPSAVYDNDVTRAVNYLNKKLFRFKYRFVFDDNFKSPFSPISAVPLPANILNPDFTNIQTNNNNISISLQSGPKNVKGIEIAVSIQNNSNVWGRFQEVVYVDKSASNIDDNSAFNYTFYNDSTYAFVSDEESNLLQSYVPLAAVSQEMPNGNVLAYGAITEGYDRELDPNVVLTVNTVAAGGGASVGSLSVVVSDVFLGKKGVFSGTPVPGTLVNIQVQKESDMTIHTPISYTTVAGDTGASVASALVGGVSGVISVDQIGLGAGEIRMIIDDDYDFYQIQILQPSVATTVSSIATWPFSSQRRLGIQYYDEEGRTNGVLYDAVLVFPPYAENISDEVLLPYVNIKIYHRPPVWAYTYQIVFTKDYTQFLYIETVDVLNDSDYQYFEITNLALNARKNPTTAAVVSWTFQDGDRMKLIRRMNDGFVFDETYDTGIEGIVTSPTISNVTYTDRTFVKVRNGVPFSGVDYSTNFFIIKLYRPALQEPSDENATFYECGVQYPILSPTKETRVHGGQVTDQSEDLTTPAEINVYEGDVYFRLRSEYLDNNGGFGQFYVQDRNFVDFFISAVSNIDGRPTAIDINAKQTFFPATIRFSQSYQQNTNINGLNLFLPANFEDCDYSYGIIQRLRVRARFMRVYQQLRVGVIYLFSKLGKSPNGDELTIQTDRLLNPIQYYNYDTGIGDHKESLASFNDADFFTSNITGGVFRASLDGITALHILYNMNSWANTNLPLRTGEYKVYGAYDQRLNNYIMALEDAPVQGSILIAAQRRLTSGFFNNKYIVRYVGQPMENDVLSIWLLDGDGVERTYYYTCQGNDTVVTAVTGLADVINADVYFTATINTLVFPEAGLVVSQVTGTDPELLNGDASIVYGPFSLSPAQTLSFSEGKDNVNPYPTFESFLSFKPDWMTTVGTMFMSSVNGGLWTHDSDQYNTFYGVTYDSEITIVFNLQAMAKKQPMSITTASSDIWDCPEIVAQSKSYGNVNQQSSLVRAEFLNLEGQFSASLKRDVNSPGGKWNGAYLKGNWLLIKFRNQTPTEVVTLEGAILKLNESPLNVR